MIGAMVAVVRRRFSATAYRRVLAWAMAGLAVSALASSVALAFSAEASDDDRDALRAVVDDQANQLDTLQQQLDCRYVLSADVSRIQADIFVTTAQALAAARRRDATAVDLYTTRLDSLADDLERASDLRTRAVTICDTEPENVLG